ncbi:MAG: hypothetical protein HN736_11650 [Anaerolineae bacterium]|jgi:hypothetical protein|nr:hypothetical protein [Anaerolineae bacterium]MBT4308800.1 hypothetical protein [Anaerolineae bacterium]MBT4457086.1 hypothetical protein [Anaerolineae bacterium]MBT4843547.1 hypothetical protein [Anaerolineae bacterium]MBT6063064.1 hypothetical protein [Anaerolineae bacterium]
MPLVVTALAVICLCYEGISSVFLICGFGGIQFTLRISLGAALKLKPHRSASLRVQAVVVAHLIIL